MHRCTGVLSCNRSDEPYFRRSTGAVRLVGHCSDGYAILSKFASRLAVATQTALCLVADAYQNVYMFCRYSGVASSSRPLPMCSVHVSRTEGMQRCTTASGCFIPVANCYQQGQSVSKKPGSPSNTVVPFVPSPRLLKGHCH
jgi:hypothetical protein